MVIRRPTRELDELFDDVVRNGIRPEGLVRAQRPDDVVESQHVFEDVWAKRVALKHTVIVRCRRGVGGTPDTDRPCQP